MTWPLGTTRRTSPTIDEAGPLLHASTGLPRTQWGRTYRAFCGAGVYHARPHEEFDPDDPRACPRCCKALRNRGVA